MIRRINGTQFEKMVLNALANLQASEEELNRLNVFPVADGDTGTNMCLTLANGVRAAKPHAEVGAYLRELSEGMLLGARGNSGVILSQLFKGLWIETAHCAVVGPGELRNALIRSYRVAYEAVVQPVEGTILTVAREGIEHIRSQIGRNTGVDAIIAMFAAEMRKTLSYTPEMLSVLKEAGVVDSGALGYILIWEGMLKYLYGDVLKPGEVSLPQQGAPTTGSLDSELFNENSVFEDGYCMEFILQLMRGNGYTRYFKLDGFISDLGVWGNSLVVIQDGTRVKVHVHTLKPAKIITLCQEYGEFVTFKLENMQLQHNEHIRSAARGPHKPFATVAVANGEGMADCFRALGCDFVIDGGATMNPSSQLFLDAYRSAGADVIAVLPDNKNAVMAAEQAAGLFGGSRVEILPCHSMVEGYYALAMDVADSTDADFRLRQLRSGAAGVTAIAVTSASRDYSSGGVRCAKGQPIAMVNGEIAAAGESAEDCLVNALRALPDADEKESCMLFRGAGVGEEAESAMLDALAEAFPTLEVSAVYGGQAIYGWLAGVC